MHTTSLTCSVLWTLAAVTARSTCDNCDLGCDRSGLTRAGSAEEQERNALQRDTESPRHRDTRRDGVSYHDICIATSTIIMSSRAVTMSDVSLEALMMILKGVRPGPG